MNLFSAFSNKASVSESVYNDNSTLASATLTNSQPEHNNNSILPDQVVANDNNNENNNSDIFASLFSSSNSENDSNTRGGNAPIELSSLLPEGWDDEINGQSNTVKRTVGTLLRNPFFSAGAGLWVLTMGGAFGRQVMNAFSALLRRRFLISMEMTNQDSSYEWMMRWLASQPHFKVRQMSVLTRDVRIYGNDMRSAECLFGPCPNVRHWFVHHGWPITLIRRRVEAKQITGDIFETLQFTTIGFNSQLFEQMMRSAQQYTRDKDSDRTVIYVSAGGKWIRQLEPRPRRPLNSVILSGNTSQELLYDVTQFLSSGEYYRNLGVPYRRGYLLHGPPGCGKTSFVMALAGELRLSICLLSLSNRGLTDETLMSLLNSAELHSIVLIEDIDRAFTTESNVSMSGLLNALDGVGAQEGKLVFMTTNHVELLDLALIRPGRADVKVEIGYLDQEQAKRMFIKFYPAASQTLQEQFASQIPDIGISAAQIQGHLFYYRHDAEAAVTQLGAFLHAAADFENKLHNKRLLQMKQKEQREIWRPSFLELNSHHLSTVTR